MNDPFEHRSPRKWLKIVIPCHPDHADTLAAWLADLTGMGVEQSMALPGDHQERTTVTGYLDHDRGTEGLIREITDFAARLHGKLQVDPPRFEEIIEEDWGRNWKKQYRPTRVSERIVIAPTWEGYRPRAGEIVIEIDPGLAFGTGLHASTRLALQLTEAAFGQKPQPAGVLDVGTGTGILAMAAALLGATQVTAIDNDPDAVVCARDNTDHNGLADKVAVSARELTAFTDPYDLVLANITHDVLLALAPQLVRLLARPGQLILAGILQGEQAESIMATFGDLGLTLADSPREDEWQAFRFIAAAG